MTERHSGYVVTLRDDIREDDAEHILNALRMISGVLSVKPIVATSEDARARDRVRHEVKMSLQEAIDAAFTYRSP